jgi:hypothetical protein
MRIIYYLLFILTICNNLNAQLNEDFADGDFTDNPVWNGDVSQFTIDASSQLQSNGDTTSASNREIYLSTPNTAINNTQWEFYVNPKVGTSSNNRMDIYLTSNQADVKGNNTGYFVRIGGTPDEVALFRKDGLGVETYLIQPPPPGQITSSSNNPTKVKVTRSATGVWNLFADYEGTGALYGLIGTATDLTYTSTSFFGVLVRYSSSNRQKYFADNFYIGPIIVDNTNPTVTSVKVINETQLEVKFSENVDLVSAETESKYLANNGLGNPNLAIRSIDNFSKVTLTFSNSFVLGASNNLTIEGVSDLAGNEMDAQIVPFVYYKAQAYDVVLNEIMADPDPPVLLPNVEYVEVFNRTEFPINIENWSIQVGTNIKMIPPIVLQPDSFLVITGLAGEEYYYDSLAVVGVTSFPALTNTGATVSLLDADLQVISTVKYSDSWYKDDVKFDGGWSIEQINPETPCAGETNWKASDASYGGTPGKKNSVLEINADLLNPEIERVTVIDKDTIRVFFTETVTLSSLQYVTRYFINNDIGIPLSVNAVAPDFKSVILALPDTLKEGILYTITVSDSLKDCVGNAFNSVNTGRFALPEVIERNDIVINEVLSDPKDGSSDFVEIYNRSQKILDIGELQLSNKDLETNLLESEEPISGEGYLIFPGEYVLLSEDVDGVKNFYNTKPESIFLQMGNFPTYNIDDGTVVLSRIADNVIIDEYTYSSKSHYPLINDTKGVSLERINFDRPANDNTNWTSASSTSGYATPGYVNSQFSLVAVSEKGKVTVSPEVFSPDNDGFDDNVSLAYEFESPNYTGSFTIYDSNGRLVKYLVRNQLLGIKGNYSWNGVNEDNEKARIGIYVIYMEAFDKEGNVVKVKKPCVLGGKL